MKLLIDLKELKKNNITIIEYLLLLQSHTEDEDLKEYLDVFSNIPDLLLTLENKGFVKISYEDTSESSCNKAFFSLREKAISLFDSKKNLFNTFLSSFPIKTPGGRYLSPMGENTIMGQNIKKKWNLLFKDKPALAEKALKVLDAEMEWRRKNNSFEYMHNALTWLNQGDFEKYEYLLTDKEKLNDRLKEDFK